MGSAVVIVGLALVFALQVAIHLRVARIPGRAAARLRAEAESRASIEGEALQQAITKRVGQLVTELTRFHEYAAEDYRTRVVATEQRARVAEARNADGAHVMTGLHAHAREAATLVTDLRALVGDLADLVYSATERNSSAAPAPEEKGADGTATTVEAAAPAVEPGEEADQRKTTEMSKPPTSGVPPASVAADEEAWDEADEHTRVWPKKGTPAGVPGAPREAQAILPGQTSPPPRGQRGPRTGAAPTAPRPPVRIEPRRAMPPPSLAREDNADERASILPTAPGAKPEGRS